MRQSANYDFRLVRCLHRGFSIWVPANLYYSAYQRKPINKVESLLSIKKGGRVINDYTIENLKRLLKYRDSTAVLNEKLNM